MAVDTRMKVLVTGAAGFIGSHFVQHLLATTDATCVAVDNFNSYYSYQLKSRNAQLFRDEDRVTLVKGDFCEREELESLFTQHHITHVMHLGGYAGVRLSVAQPSTYVRNNVEGTLRVLEAARKFPVTQFVLASSSTVYGKFASAPFSEYNPLGIPASPYGASKRAAELMAMTYHHLHDIPVVCVRPFSVYGPRLRPDLALSIFADKILRDQPLPLFGDGSYCRDMTYVSDVCDGLWQALTRSKAIGHRINLGCGNPIAMKRVIRTLSQVIGKPAHIEYLPAREEDLDTTYADLTLARKLLDYHPQVMFDHGIREFVRWYREFHNV